MMHAMQKRDIRLLRQAAEDVHTQDKEYRSATNLDFVIYILLVLFIVCSVQAFIGRPIRVDGDSMFPTLLHGDSMFPTLLHGERMIVEKISYYFTRPERGNIIVCYYPAYRESRVKRVIGLPGDTIAIEYGRVILNGDMLDESEYWNDHMYGHMAPRTIKEGHVFVMGDNRNYSGDSRDPHVGDIPYEKIVGRAASVMWPLRGLRLIRHVDYGVQPVPIGS